MVNILFFRYYFFDHGFISQTDGVYIRQQSRVASKARLLFRSFFVNLYTQIYLIICRIISYIFVIYINIVNILLSKLGKIFSSRYDYRVKLILQRLSIVRLSTK